MKKVTSNVTTRPLLINYQLGWVDGGIATSDFQKNDPVKFNRSISNMNSNEETQEKEFSSITLPAYESFKLFGNVSITADKGKNFERGIRWYNVTEGKWIGSEGGMQHDISVTSMAGSGLAIAYHVSNKKCRLELRCSHYSGVIAAFSRGTYFDVQHFDNQKTR